MGVVRPPLGVFHPIHPSFYPAYSDCTACYQCIQLVCCIIHLVCFEAVQQVAERRQHVLGYQAESLSLRMAISIRGFISILWV